MVLVRWNVLVLHMGLYFPFCTQSVVWTEAQCYITEWNACALHVQRNSRTGWSAARGSCGRSKYLSQPGELNHSFAFKAESIGRKTKIQCFLLNISDISRKNTTNNLRPANKGAKGFRFFWYQPQWYKVEFFPVFDWIDASSQLQSLAPLPSDKKKPPVPAD
jgi:hypothetical protein